MVGPAKLRIGYVPEHFSSPLLQLGRSSWGREHVELVSQPSGTGQMLTSLQAQQNGGQKIDVAVALTESLIAALAKGREDFKLVGSYVKSSLNWAVITGTSAHADRYQSIEDLKGETIGISRVGSGSMVMASVMALLQGWTDEHGNVSQVQFKVQDTFENLRKGVNLPATASSTTSKERNVSTSLASTASAVPAGQISAEDFAQSAQSYVAKYSAASSRISNQAALGPHLYSKGWGYTSSPVPLLERSFELLDTPIEGDAAGRKVLRIQQVVARSSTWGTPVLYFRASTSEGTLLTLSEIEQSSLLLRNTSQRSNATLVHGSSDADTTLSHPHSDAQPSEWASLSLGNHPVTDESWIVLHPCQTASWISMLQSGVEAPGAPSDGTRPSTDNKSVEYLEAFLSLCASAVEMRADQSRPAPVGVTGQEHRQENAGQALEKPQTAAFMWEWFTTKPFVDAGEVRFIGSVPTPWPSWSIAASVPSVLSHATSTPASSTPSDEEVSSKLSILTEFLQRLQAQIVLFTSSDDEARAFVQQEMGYEAEDVRSWYEQVRWVGDSRASIHRPSSTSTTASASASTSGGEEPGGAQVATTTQDNSSTTTTTTISKATLLNTLQTLVKAGAIPTPTHAAGIPPDAEQGAWDLNSFVQALPAAHGPSGLVE